MRLSENLPVHLSRLGGIAEKDDPVIVVVIPAFEVERHVAAVVEGLPGYVDHVVVVDDGSHDSTGEVVQRLIDQRVHLVVHQRNQGVGAAMLSGYAYALSLGADVIVKMDGDGQMDAQQLPVLLEPILSGRADFAKGNRFLHQYALGDMPLARRLGNVALSFLTKLSSGYWNIYDPTNGYIAITAQAAALLDSERIARDYFFETSLLLELQRLKAVVVDVPMPARYLDEQSRLSLPRVTLSFPGRLLRGLTWRIHHQYFLLDFNVVSLLLVLGLPLLIAGAAWGAYRWYVSLATGIPATAGTVLLAVLPIVLGVQFLLQALVLDITSTPPPPLQQRLSMLAAPHTRTSLSEYLRGKPVQVFSPAARRGDPSRADAPVGGKPGSAG